MAGGMIAPMSSVAHNVRCLRLALCLVGETQRPLIVSGSDYRCSYLDERVGRKVT